MTRDGADTLRTRLLNPRRDALAQLAEADVLDGGLLQLIAGAGAALTALDADGPADTEVADRVVLADDGEAIRLFAYIGANPAAVVDLSPHRAIALAAELLRASLPRIDR